jgi:signal transduction histidine kinase
MVGDEKDNTPPVTQETCDEELEEARRRARELSTLLDISMALPATTDLDNLLNAIITKSVEPFEAADAGVVFLYDPQEEVLIPRASMGYRQEPLSQVRLRPGEAMAGKVLRRGEPLLASHPDEVAEAMENLREENRFRLDRARGQLAQPRSAVSVPLVSRDSVLGALTVVNLRRYAAFSNDDVHFLQAIANQMAIVVENAQLWTEISRAQALEEANRLKDEFLSSISHQLLTPITAIRAAADILQTSTDGHHPEDPQWSLINNIARNTLRLQILVQEVLDLARLRSGAVSLALRKVDLRRIIEESVAAIRPLADEKDQTLTVDCPRSPCPVSADRGRLDQVAMNLLSNACKFTPRRGSIQVAVHGDGAEYEVSVADTGPGIAPGEQERIFDRFYSRSRGPEQRAGTGLGLAIAKALVELHGGRVWVDSEQGRGSTFRFALPKETT